MTKDLNVSHRQFHVSAPGKVILCGEHAVVYGKSAIACSLGVFTHGTIKSSQALTLSMNNFNFSHTWDLNEFKHYNLSTVNFNLDHALLERIKQKCDFATGLISESVSTFLYLWISIRNNNHGISMIIDSKLPIGGGLGSSASFCAILATSFLCFYGYINDPSNLSQMDLDLINSWAFVGESLLHGNPSGIDNTLVVYGGAKLFRKGEMKNIKGFNSMRFLLIDSKVEKNTARQVTLVRKRFPLILNPILDAIQEISLHIVKLFGNGLSPQEINDKLSILIDINHSLLNSCGVGHEILDKIVSITKRRGLSSKLTGAGGGGCVLTLIPYSYRDDEVQSLILELESSGFSAFAAEIGGLGVHISLWQIERRKWKLDLIQKSSERTKLAPIPIPESPDADLQFTRVSGKGSFLNTEFLVGPRSLPGKESHGGVMSSGGDIGFLVYSPFKMKDGRLILVNRGWIPREWSDSAENRKISDEIEIDGILRQGESQSGIMKIKNDPSKNQWFFADTKQMSEICGSKDILVELVADSPINKQYFRKYFPLPREPEINLVNNHLGYAVTWFALSAFTFIGLIGKKRRFLR